MIRPGRNTVLFALLGASLALNLVLGARMLGAQDQPERPRRFESIVQRMEAALPEPDRAAFARVMDEERDRYAGALEAMRAAQREVDAATLREPFDPAALRAAMQDWRARWNAFSDSFGEALVPALAAVSPEGRQRIVASRRGPRP